MEENNYYFNNSLLTEAEANERHLNVKPLNVNNFIKVNSLAEVTNPVFFTKNNSPTPDGLLSNEIFGIDKATRSQTFAYVSLGKEIFMNPLMYKVWSKLDSKVVACVHGSSKFKIVGGELVEDPDGECGIKFLKKNFDSIKIKSTESETRDYYIAFLQKFKDRMFIDNMIIIPAFYRDINTEAGDAGMIGVGDINKLYNSLIIATRSLKESSDYGLTLSDSVRGRIQDIITQIYDWFSKEPRLPGKHGIIRRASQSKTTDLSARVVLSAPNLTVENMEDMICDIDHSAVPLAAVATTFFPYMIFYMRRFFENEFANSQMRSVVVKDKNGKPTIKQFKMKDYQITFSDTVLKEELDRFIHGYANRLRPIMLPLEDPKMKEVPLVFKGSHITEKEFLEKKDMTRFPIMERCMTWCDLIFMAAVEVSKDKTILVTRYPIDSCYNQFPSYINVSSTKDMEPMVINNTFYRFYPKIRQSMIGKNTSNMFVDTLNISNLRIGSIGGDYIKSVVILDNKNLLNCGNDPVRV